MKILKPTILTDAILDSTNVHEVAPALWDSGTPYAAGAFVHVVNGVRLDIYESKQGTNLNNAPATETDWWVFRSYTYPEYASGTTYALGARVIVAATHKVYESLSAGNVGNAVSDTTKWVLVGATNPWISFDAKVGSQTERTGSITFSLSPGFLNSITIFNLDASTVQITLTDPTDGIVYDETIDLISTDNVYDGYTYCFSEFITTQNIIRNMVATDIPPYGSATLDITLTGADDTTTVKCGEIVFGPVTESGITQYNAGFEIIDYSRKEADAYGDFEIIERAFSKRVTADLVIQNALLPYLKTVLENIRATPVVWILTEDTNLADPFLTYGFYKNFKVVVPYPDYCTATLEIEGLT